jgi:hypothetical protein
MSLSLDSEQTIIKFNGKNFDLTNIKETLIKSSEYLKVLIDECDGDISIDTELITEDIFERVIDLVQDKEISFDKMNEIILALNYLAIDKDIVKRYYSKFKSKIKKEKLDTEDILSIGRHFKDIGIFDIKEIFQGQTDKKEYHQLLNDIKGSVEMEEFIEIYNLWKTKFYSADSECEMYIDFIHRFKDKDDALLDLYDFKNGLIYKESKDPYLKSDTSYSTGENILLSQEDALLKFHKSTHGILKDLDYDNIFVAGGYALYSVSRHLLRGNSDVDMFVYGPDEVYRKNAVERVVEYLKKYAKENNRRIFFAKQWLVITVCIEDIDINFQIIETVNTCMTDVIDMFGLDYIQVLYDGDRFRCNGDFLKSLKYQTVFSLYDEVCKEHMYLKAFDKGYSLFNKIHTDIKTIREDPCTIKKLNSYYYPSSKTDNDEILAQLSKSFRTNHVSYNNVEDFSDNTHGEYDDDDDYTFACTLMPTIPVLNEEEIKKKIKKNPINGGVVQIYDRKTNTPLDNLWLTLISEIKIVLPVVKGVYYGNHTIHRMVITFDKEDTEVIDFIKETEKRILDNIGNIETYSDNRTIHKYIMKKIKRKKARNNFITDLSFGTINIKWVDMGHENECEYQDECFNFIGEFVISPYYVWYNKEGEHGIKFKVCDVRSFDKISPIKN